MRRALALALALLPGLALATPYDGTYRQNANADCGLVGVDGGALKIEDGIFYGVESQCRMTRPVNVVNMDATLYTMVCSGEGTNWTERAMVMDSAGGDGIIMVWNGYAFRYDRCVPPDQE
ncbi:MAG: hypothetical protein GVY31_12910 [Alphaproteobacteria bacterium]|jgi:hypothetical protein|nr:hypothetical protein [Alphaproteobacteria bacterium]